MRICFTKSGLKAHPAFAIHESERPVAPELERSPALVDTLQRSIQEMERIGKGLYRLALTHETMAREASRASQSDFSEMRRRLAEDYLPVMDALERLAHALSAAGDGSEGAKAILAPLAEGGRIVEQKGMAYLQAMGVQPIEAVGAPFDPKLHQAVETRTAAPEMEGRVVEEVLRGYRIGDKVLRAAQVAVGTREPTANSTNQQDSRNP